MLMIYLMIILFHLKLDKFYYIEARNSLKIICCDLFFVRIKMSYYYFNKEYCYKKQKIDIITVVVKKKLLNVRIAKTTF